MEDPFANSDPIVKDLYEHLMSKLKGLGPMRVETKKTSMHIVNHAAFLGIDPKRKLLEINIVSLKPLDQKRGYKTEQVSRNRFHNRMRIEAARDISARLVEDIRGAYSLMLK